MSNYLTSINNNDYEIEICENDGKFELEIENLRDESKSTIVMDRYDMIYLIKSIAEASTDLAKEMITGILETM